MYSENIREIWVVPLSREGFSGKPIEEIQSDFESKNSLIYTKNNNFDRNSLLLFRMNNKVLASALYDETIPSCNNSYPYKIIFKEDSVKVFELITENELRNIDDTYLKRGYRNLDDINIKYRKAILDIIERKMTEYSESAKIECELFLKNRKEYTEGVKKHIWKEYRTRNYKVVQDAKYEHKQKNDGRLPCEVCGFDFMQIYGKLGENFIEAHHNIHHSKQGERKIKTCDLSLVCSNCHSMLHKNEAFTIEILQKHMYSR